MVVEASPFFPLRLSPPSLPWTHAPNLCAVPTVKKAAAAPMEPVGLYLLHLCGLLGQHLWDLMVVQQPERKKEKSVCV